MALRGESSEKDDDQTNASQDAAEDYQLETRCGLGEWHPPWLQRLANNKVYVLMQGLIGINTFGLSAYFVATVSTMEKRFKIPSKTIGVITSAWDIGGVLSIPILGYLGGRGHKTRYVAMGTVVMGVSCFVRLLPHLLYGPGQDALELTLEYAQGFNLANYSHGIKSSDGLDLCGNTNLIEDDCSTGSSTSWPAIILFIAHFLLGAGCSMYAILTMVYLDDNTTKNKVPLFHAASHCMRMLGPTVGYAFAGYALSQYVVPSLHPIIGNTDPRWIGAWWMGWGPFGIAAFVLAAMMCLFPRELPRTARRKAQKQIPTVFRQTSFKDFRKTLSKLIRNKVLMYNTFSAVFYLIGNIGYWTFMPKYMETQYRQSASGASLISGAVGLVFVGLGIVTSATIIAKFKPRARYLAAWCVFVEFVDVVGHSAWTFLSCDPDDMHGTFSADKSWNFTATCNSACDCGSTVKYAPVCSMDGNITFFSPCHAGCTTSDLINGTKMFSNCSCLGGGQAVDGLCDVDCTTNFTIFLVTQCLMYFLSSSGKAGNSLIQLRCVEEVDKSFAMAITEFAIGGLAFIPSPIVYGMLLDYACTVWGQTCGQSGNCWLYDGKTIRMLINITASVSLLISMLLDIGVWYHVEGVKIYDDEDDKKKDEATALREVERPFLEPASNT